MIRSSLSKASSRVYNRLGSRVTSFTVCEDISIGKCSCTCVRGTSLSGNVANDKARRYHNSSVSKKCNDNYHDDKVVNNSLSAQPIPLAQLAYEEKENGEEEELEKGSILNDIRNNGEKPRPLDLSSSSFSENIVKPIAFKGAGGGGSGRYRCPKCGTYVTFRHINFEENTFYCATCSGWFLVTPNSNAVDSGFQQKESMKGENKEQLMAFVHVSFIHLSIYLSNSSIMKEKLNSYFCFCIALTCFITNNKKKRIQMMME